jgi:hypothetical protein
LAINGNPTVRTQGFRKRAIVELPKLCYLDRPVEELERIGAMAFASGGAEAERAAKEKYREDQRVKRSNEMEAFREWQRTQRAQRQAAISQGQYVGMREFTSEEVERRRVEAEDAANAERELIATGLPKVASKYWQMESSAVKRDKDGYNFDALDAAVREIKAEEEQRRRTEQDDHGEQAYEDELHSSATASTSAVEAVPSIPAATAAGGGGGMSETHTASLGVEDTAAVGRAAESQSPPPLPVPTDDPSEDGHVSRVTGGDAQNTGPAPSSVEVGVDANDYKQNDADAEEARLQYELEARVMESLEIYKRQRDASGSSMTNSTSVYVSSTWSSVNIPSAPVEERALYWTEAMDIGLAKLVREHNFEFNLVAEALRTAMGRGDFGGDLIGKQHRMTYDACRVRWSQLDARQWAVLDDRQSTDPSGSASSNIPLYGMRVRTPALGQPQPSYQAMASMASASIPSYLRVPTSFPSVMDPENDSDAEEGGEGDDSAGDGCHPDGSNSSSGSGGGGGGGSTSNGSNSHMALPVTHS